MPSTRWSWRRLEVARRYLDWQLQQLTGAPADSPFNCAVDNGAPWLVVRVNSARDCLALEPDAAALADIVHTVNTHGLAVYGPHDADGPATFEVRCLMAGGSFGVGEDPVTGSANAALAGLLSAQQRRPGSHYTARQGTVLGRAGNISVHYDDAAGKTWIGGRSVTIVDGTFRLP